MADDPVVLNPEDFVNKCCHSEVMRHQVTRFALEKALKLSEVLMQEISRLDRVVKRHHHQI